MSAEQTPDIERVLASLAEALPLAVMHYYGFTDEDIAVAEQVHPGRVCDEDECFDEDGTSVHGQAWVELGATANTVIEAVLPALAPVLAAAEGCWQPCDQDCEVGPVHCEAVHLPSHKAKTVLHSADCLAAAVREAEQRATEVVRLVERDMSEAAISAWRSAEARRGLSDHEALLVHADALTRWSERIRMALNGDDYRADRVAEPVSHEGSA